MINNESFLEFRLNHQDVQSIDCETARLWRDRQKVQFSVLATGAPSSVSMSLILVERLFGTDTTQTPFSGILNRAKEYREFQ